MNSQTEQKKFLLGKEPFIRKADSLKYGTDVIMRDFMIALLPLIIFAWIKNGLLPFIKNDTNSIFTMLYPLIFIFIGGFTSWLLEFIAYKYFIKEKNVFNKLKHSFAIIPGTLLAMICSVNTPIWVLIIGCFFATIIGKVLFGGFGNNIFNPALVGYLFISVAYTAVINKHGGFFNPSEVEIIAGSTPMTNFSNAKFSSLENLIGSYGSLKDFFIGNVPGSLAETSSLLCIISCIYLIVRKVINWRIPVFYVGSVFILSYFAGALNGYSNTIDYSLFNIFSGGLMFGAVFMATEPVTSPKTNNGKIVYALFLGVLTVLFRFRGNMPEGVATSIMAMNMLSLIIDRITAKLRVTEKKFKIVYTYCIMALIMIGIGIYSITYMPTIEISDAIISSDEYEFNMTVDSEKVVVTTNSNKEITNINIKHYNINRYKNEFNRLINEYQIDVSETQYPSLVNKTEEGTKTTLEIKAKRNNPYANEVLFVVVIENNSIISISSDSKEKESYTNEGYTEWSGIHPEDVLPERIISSQPNLDDIEIVATATQTSNLYIQVAKFALNYIEKEMK